MDQKLKNKSWSHRLLEENIGKKKLLEIGLGSNFLDMSPKAQTTKKKSSGTSDLKASALQEKKSAKWKGILGKGREYLWTIYISDKGLISKIYKEVTQLSNKQKTNLI